MPEFRGDREQLIQAVLNIAHNAAQALTERVAAGDALLTLRTRVARQVTIGNRQLHRLALELHIEDNGPGCPSPSVIAFSTRWCRGVTGALAWV
jgi:two-component system nitrogen regulation sensor histidine kinase GlnL